MKSRHLKLFIQNRFTFFAILLIAIANFSIAASDENPKMTPALNSFCKKLDLRFKKYNWDASECQSYEWIHIRNSVLGDPLTWTVFGDASDEGKETFKKKDVSIIMCGVHGDEITPIKFCFDVMKYLKKVYNDPEQSKEFINKIVIVVPLVNPDSFFKANPTRVNARGVDINRNFPTKDWMKDARRLWISKLRKDKRRNPGMSASSEPEVVFQVNLIRRYGPDKIISVHSPLTMLDYDGPNTIVDGFVDGAKAQELLIQMSKDASDYKIENYPFFPGSLGNWAGKERDIPTYTLELPTSNPAKSAQYWKLFQSAIHKAIAHDLKENGATKIDEKNSTNQNINKNPTDQDLKVEEHKSADLTSSNNKKID